MRIWSIHPKYLGRKQLSDAWYEALICRKIARGEKQSRISHPHSQRMLAHPKPIDFINGYIISLYSESILRGYDYNAEFLELYDSHVPPMEVSMNQLHYEFACIQEKIVQSGKLEQFEKNKEMLPIVQSSIMFEPYEGEIQSFEDPEESTLNLMNEIFK
jgi:hypothetical protein